MFDTFGQATGVSPLVAGAETGGRLHFASEHARDKFVGYMEGATSSGAGVARRLAKQGFHRAYKSKGGGG